MVMVGMLIGGAVPVPGRVVFIVMVNVNAVVDVGSGSIVVMFGKDVGLDSVTGDPSVELVPVPTGTVKVVKFRVASVLENVGAVPGNVVELPSVTGEPGVEVGSVTVVIPDSVVVRVRVLVEAAGESERSLDGVPGG